MGTSHAVHWMQRSGIKTSRFSMTKAQIGRACLQELMYQLIRLKPPANSTQGKCNMPPGILSLVVDVEETAKWGEVFLTYPNPLGLLGDTLNSVYFTASCWISPQPRSSHGSTMFVPERWAFFRAISRLKNLNQLILRRNLWSNLTEPDIEAASPLANLPGLCVQDLNTAKVIVYVEGRRVIVTEHCIE